MGRSTSAYRSCCQAASPPWQTSSTLTNSVTCTSGLPCRATMNRKAGSVTPSIGESPMIGCGMLCQKLIGVMVAQPDHAHKQPRAPVPSSLLSPARLGESNSLDMARRHRYPTLPDEGRPVYGLAGTDTREHRRPRSSRRTAPLEPCHRCLCQPRLDGDKDVATHPRAPCA